MPSDKIRLSLLGLPALESLDDISSVTHLSKKLLYNLSRFADDYYFVYELPKKTGGHRTIAQPSKDLKAVQSWILRNILDRLTVSTACKGFNKGSNIVDNAKPHIAANSTLCLDLADFFPSVKVNQIWTIFRTVGYSPRISAVLARICSYNGVLPQGSPASPRLANLVCLRMDARLLGYVGKKGIIYTRYADDLTFSAFTPVKLIKALPTIEKIISSEGFELNRAKTRLAGPARQHRVTGLIVTDFDVGIGRKKLRELRSKLHHICVVPEEDVSQSDLNHLKGWLAFVKSVDKNRINMINDYINGLKIKYPSSAITSI